MQFLLYRYKEDEQVWDKYIEKEYLINLNNLIGNVCKRTPIPYIKPVRDIRKEIEVYCYERDEVLEELEKFTLTNKEKCEHYNNWMNEKKALFRKKPAWHIYANNPRYKSVFKISSNCDKETMFQNKLNCQNEYRKRSKKFRKFKKNKSKTALKKKSQKGSDNEEDTEDEEDEKKSSPYGKEKTKDEEDTPIKNDEEVTNPTYHEPKKQKTTKTIERSFDSHNPRNKIIPASTPSSTISIISPTLSTIPKTSTPVTPSITSTITATTPSLYTPISSSINHPKRTTVLPRISHNTDTISDITISTKNRNILNNEDEIKYRRFPENIHKGDKILIEKIHDEDTKTSDSYKKILPGKSGQAGPPRNISKTSTHT